MTDRAPLIKSKFRIATLNTFIYRSFRGMVNEHMRVTDAFASCVSCRNFDAPQYWCKKYQQHPPADIIANSCIIGYDDMDDIPY
jgi:hypothetical protein